jgi:quercetin dioxygenase-like cupin family protein
MRSAKGDGMTTQATQILGPADGETVRLFALGVRFMIGGEQTGGRFSMVEHPLAPRALGAPLHMHATEDEYSYVLEGRVGMQLGDQVVKAGPGEMVFKPRGQQHAFWNAGDQPARLLEIISPAGFENYFREIAPLLAAPEPDEPAIGEVLGRYQLDMDFSTIPTLAERHGLELD